MSRLRISAMIHRTIALGCLCQCALPNSSHFDEETCFANELDDRTDSSLACILACEATPNDSGKHSLLQVQSVIDQNTQTRSGKQSTSMIRRVLLAASKKKAIMPVSLVSNSTLDHVVQQYSEVVATQSSETSTEGGTISSEDGSLLASVIQMGVPQLNEIPLERHEKLTEATSVEERLPASVAAQGNHTAADTIEKAKLIETLGAIASKAEGSGGVSGMASLAFVFIGLILLGLLVLFLYLRSQGLLANAKPSGGAEDLLHQGSYVAAGDSRASLQATGSQSTPMRRPVGTAHTSPQLGVFRASPLPTRQQLPPLPPREAMQVASPHLCPGLVVPPSYECTLVVPVLPSSAAYLDPVALYAKDLQGNPILQTDVLATKVAKVGQRPLVVLRSCTGPRLTGEQAHPVLCSCKVSYEAGGQKSICIFDSRNEMFAQIRKDPANRRYFLTNSGSRLNFEGDFIGHEVIVIDDLNQIVAETTPQSDYGSSSFKLSVKPGTDIGLIVSVLYAVVIMERD